MLNFSIIWIHSVDKIIFSYIWFIYKRFSPPLFTIEGEFTSNEPNCSQKLNERCTITISLLVYASISWQEQAAAWIRHSFVFLFLNFYQAAHWCIWNSLFDCATQNFCHSADFFVCNCFMRIWLNRIWAPLKHSHSNIPFSVVFCQNSVCWINIMQLISCIGCSFQMAQLLVMGHYNRD